MSEHAPHKIQDEPKRTALWLAGMLEIDEKPEQARQAVKHLVKIVDALTLNGGTAKRDG
jgi:hypothetical protein